MSVKFRPGALIMRHLNSEVISFQKMWQLFLPILFDTFMVCLMSVLSSSMVSSSGEAAVAAVNMVETVNLFLTNFYVAIATGGTVIVAQYIGHQDHKSAGEAAAQALTSATLLSVVIAALLILFSNQIIGMLFGKAEPLVLEYGHTYLICCALSYPGYSLFQVSVGALRGSGDTKASMVISIALNAVFLAGNFVMINLLKLGVLGSGISLIFCRTLIGVLSVVYLVRRRKDLQIHFRSFTRFNLQMQKSILYIGLPTALEQVFFHGGRIVTQTFMVTLGTAAMTSNAIANSIFNLVITPASSINVLTVTVVGYCIGAGRPDEAKRLMKSLAVTAGAVQLVLGVLVWPLLPALIGIYHVSAETTAIIMNCMLIVMIAIPFTWSYAAVIPSGLRAAGDARFVSLVSLTTMWVVRVTLGYLLGITFGFGIEGVWIAMCSEWVFKGGIDLWRMRGTKWYQHKLIEN